MTVDKETAKEDYQRFLDKNWLKRKKINEADEDVHDKRDNEDFKDLIIEAIMRGACEVSDEGQITYTPERSENRDTLTFYDPESDVLMAMDKRKEHESVAKLNVSMGALTKTNGKRFSRMKKNPDWDTCVAIFNTFLVR